MRDHATQPLRDQILHVNLMVIFLTVLLTLGSTLYLTLHQERRSMDEKLLNSARLLTQFPEVAQALSTGVDDQALWKALDQATSTISDIDMIVVADEQGRQFYHPDHQSIGLPYAGHDQKRIFNGESHFISDDTGTLGAERCAYAEVRDQDGILLGFVMVGIYMRSYTAITFNTVVRFVLIGAVAAVMGILFSRKLSERIKRSLMGYEPSVFLRLFHQREEILEALEEGVIAIDDARNIMYINNAAAEIIGTDRVSAIGLPLHKIYPASKLDRVMETKKSEYNVNLHSFRNVRILSDRMPIWDGDKVVGAVAIFRNRTEVTRLAEDLTGVRHMVGAMRAYTHEFMNKLHVVLGLLQIGETQKAEEYIMDVTGIQREVVGLIMEQIEDLAAAALLVGKTSRCTELGIRLRLDPHSHLSKQGDFLSPEAYITVLGNLIENAIDVLNQSAMHGTKEITVTIREDEEQLFLCVEDTGPGISVKAQEKLFETGYSTKGADRGTGLALVKEIVDAYRGEIRVESETGVGTAFFLTFHRQN